MRTYVFKCNATKVTELHGSSKSSPTEFYEACIATVNQPLAIYIYLYISDRYVHTVHRFLFMFNNYKLKTGFI